MKVLLDEDLPHTLRRHLLGHEVVTAGYMGWNGLKNGELLREAEASGIEVLVTGDGSLSYQQNLAGRLIAIVTLSATDWRIINKHLEKVVAAVNVAVRVHSGRLNVASSVGDVQNRSAALSKLAELLM